MTDCPSRYSIDTGDFAEPEVCSLPVEHNADDEPWHVGGYSSDGIDVTVRWRWDQDGGTTCYWRPKGSEPTSAEQRIFYAGRLLDRLFPDMPLAAPVSVVASGTGQTVRWRQWAMIPTVAASDVTTQSE